MAVEVAVYQIGEPHRRSSIICDCMMAGIAAAGDTPTKFYEASYREPILPIAVFYGYVGNLPKIMQEHRDAGLHAVYIDLGYFGRHDGGRWTGYHKLCVNNRHPTEYFQKRAHDNTRASALKIAPAPWRPPGRYILLAGMGAKGARAEGYRPEEWERAAIAEIRKHTDRPIIYRPKPSCKESGPIEGTHFSPKTQVATDVLKRSHAVVTHHSNLAVDALIMGVPAFCWDGVAKPLSLQDLSQIETPVRPEARAQWIADIAWTQWSIDEMRKGGAWRYLKQEGLL